MTKETLWRTLFLMLLTINITLLTTNYFAYAGEFGAINSLLTEEFDSALQSNASMGYGLNYAAANEALLQLKTMHPPYWKVAKHQEYRLLAEQLHNLESQVRQQQQSVFQSSDTWRASYAHMPNVKPVDIDRMVQSMVDNQKRMEMLRQQQIPIYKTKLEQFKTLGRSLS
jgi:hypothetical protein